MSQADRGRQLSVYYQTHWDREWYLPFRAYQLRLADVVDDILERLESGVLPCFMLDGQTVVLEDYLELRPENRQRLKALVESGKLSIGPWFVMPDEFLVGGESLIRNLVAGLQESRAWGCHQFTGYLPDTFGHSADIPTLLQGCGLDSAVVWRGIHPDKSLFNWQSPSGAKVLALHLTDGYFQMMLQDWTATPEEQLTALDALVDKLEAASPLGDKALLPMGGDHLGPLPAAAHDRLLARYPDIAETTPERYLADVAAMPHIASRLDQLMGELADNKGSFLLPGVYSARLYLKQANRRMEHLLTRKLEPLLAMAQVFLPKEKQLTYPAQALGIAWKTLILNHPHDSICGCSVDEVHRENEVRFDHVSQLGESLLHRTAQAFASRFIADYWVFFNTSASAYSGVVSVIEDVLDADAPTALVQVESTTELLQDEYLHDSQRIPLSHLRKVRRQGWIWADQLLPYSVTSLTKTLGGEYPAEQAVIAKGTMLKNDCLSIEVASDGSLTVTDLKTGQSHPHLLRFTDRPEQGDSYNSAPVPGTDEETARFVASRMLHAGPLVGALELTHRFEQSGLVLHTHVSLQAGSPVLAFETAFTNQQENHKLQVAFETGKPVDTVVAESHFSCLSRQYDPAYRELDVMPAERWKELKTNTGPVQRFFSANGHSFITEGLAEYEVYQERVSITLLRAFSAISSGETGVRGAQAGPPFPTPEGQCVNRSASYRYAWLPTPADSASLYAEAERFYGTAWGQSGTGQIPEAVPLTSLVRWESQTLVASACYWSPGKGLVLRLLNTSHQPLSTSLEAGFAYRQLLCVNFLEEEVTEAEAKHITVGPQDVITLLFAV